MGYVYRILNRPRFARAPDTRRVWLRPGEPILIGPRLTLTFYLDRAYLGLVQQPRLVFQGGARVVMATPQAGDWVNVEAWAGLHVVPIALEQDMTGRVRRLRVQFIRTRADVRWAS